MIIVKVGGGNAIKKDVIVKDIKSLDERVVFVHGGRIQTDKVAKKLGLQTKRITSPSGMVSVFTDRQALEVLTMVYAGLLNKQWVSAFQKVGVNAIGLSGADGRLWLGKRKKHLLSIEGGKTKLVKGTFTGRVERVNRQLIKLLTRNGYLPVITQPAISSDGRLINSDNDRNIAVMAAALRVKKLVVLFEASGFLKDPRNEASIIRKISKKELVSLMKYARGTMKKKVLGAIEAFEHGVKTVYWGDGRIKEPIKNALAGKGTTIQ